MITKTLYQTAARAVGGRDGSAATLDGTFQVKLTTPKELGGLGGEGSNPEQLFAAGYAACFLNAMKLTAIQDHAPFPSDASVTSTVSLDQRLEGGFGLAIEMIVALPGVDRLEADRLVHRADAVCPYSNAIRTNVEVKFTIV
jgi:osmotically inducible protein OsmC